jgi:alkylation response protein AidB-like acyl-CoA dehydrogenase
VETEVKDSIIPYVEKAEFPAYLIPKFQKLGFSKHFFKKPYGESSSTLLQGLIIAELARGDAGVSTIVIVQCCLIGYTIDALGSE